MQKTDIDTSIYEEVVKGYKCRGLGLGELAHVAREVETELNAWIVGLGNLEREDLIK